MKLTGLLEELVAPPDGPDPANQEQGETALQDGHAEEDAPPLALVAGASPLFGDAPEQKGRQRRSCCDVTKIFFLCVVIFSTVSTTGFTKSELGRILATKGQ